MQRSWTLRWRGFLLPNHSNLAKLPRNVPRPTRDPPRPPGEELLPLAFTFGKARKASVEREHLIRILQVLFEPLVQQHDGIFINSLAFNLSSQIGFSATRTPRCVSRRARL